MTIGNSPQSQIERIRMELTVLETLIERGVASFLSWDEGYRAGQAEAEARIAAEVQPSVTLRRIAGHLEANMPRKDEAGSADRAARHRLIALCYELVDSGEFQPVTFHNLADAVRATES